MNKNQLQQGDVTLKRIARLPKGAKKVKPGQRGHVLAEGEVTGHAHCIPAVEGVTLHRLEDVLFVKSEKPIRLAHEEHKAFTILPGVWEVGGVREFDYFKQMERKVID